MLDFAKETKMYKHFIHFIDDYDIVPHLTSPFPVLAEFYFPLGNYYIIRHNNDNYISLEKQKDANKIVDGTFKFKFKYHSIHTYDANIKEYFHSVYIYIYIADANSKYGFIYKIKTSNLYSL